MKLNNKGTNVGSEELALTDTELETVLGGQGWDCTPPYGGGSPDYGSPYYGGGYPNYGGSSCGGGSPSYGNSSYAPNYGSYSPSDSGAVAYSVTTTTTTYYTGGAPVSGSSCGGSY
jgi:hypothetical protein